LNGARWLVLLVEDSLTRFSSQDLIRVCSSNNTTIDMDFPARRNHHRGGGRGGRGRGRGGRGRGGGPWPRSRHTAAGDDATTIEEFGVTDDAASTIRVAVEGCSHGELDVIYHRLVQHQQREYEKYLERAAAQDSDALFRPIDLLICCGDFQSLRCAADFHSVSIPPKYRTSLGSFYRYYTGQLVAPVLTIVIGGNHEVSQQMYSELYYGGWLAPNIYYLGVAGVIRFRGLRIAGLSGIFKPFDYHRGHYESIPYQPDSLRSVYHVRHVNTYRLTCLNPGIDVFLSHDWPRGIEQHGDTAALLRQKPFFAHDVQHNQLGSPANMELLHALQPTFWFAAHLHVKFTATVRHASRRRGGDTAGDASRIRSLVPSQVVHSSVASSTKPPESTAEHTTQFVAPNTSAMCQSGPDLTDLMTQFLALDKCLPRRQYLSIVNIPVASKVSTPPMAVLTGKSPAVPDDSTPETEIDSLNEASGQAPAPALLTPPQAFPLEYDLEWLAILKKTHSLSSRSRQPVRNVPSEPQPVSDADIDWVRQRLRSRGLVAPVDSNADSNCFPIPLNFEVTVPGHTGPPSPFPRPLPPPLAAMGNPQTDFLLDLLDLPHRITIPYSREQSSVAGTDSLRAVANGFMDVDDNEILLDDSGTPGERGRLDVASAYIVDRIGAKEPIGDANEIDLDRL
jgi:lariat debranching enzyme